VISSAFRLLAFSAFDGVDEEEEEDEDELDVADDIVDDEEDIDDVLSSFWFNISDIVGFNALLVAVFDDCSNLSSPLTIGLLSFSLTTVSTWRLLLIIAIISLFCHCCGDRSDSLWRRRTRRC